MVGAELGGERQRGLIAHLPQQVDDGAGQAPLRDGDAVRHEETDQQDGQVAQAELDEVRHRKRQGPDQLRDRPAQGDPPRKRPRNGNCRRTSMTMRKIAIATWPATKAAVTTRRLPVVTMPMT